MQEYGFREFYELIWHELHLAVEDTNHPFRCWGLASHQRAHTIGLRTMIIRAVDEEQALLYFYTDKRSPKVNEIRISPRIALLAYHPRAHIQLSIQGMGQLHKDDDCAWLHWQDLPPSERRRYLAPYAPSTPTPVYTANQPVQSGRFEEDRGYENFCVIACKIHTIDFYKGRAEGSERILFDLLRTPDDGEWATWLCP